MSILCENSSIRDYIKITRNTIENNLDLKLQDRFRWNGPVTKNEKSHSMQINLWMM